MSDDKPTAARKPKSLLTEEQKTAFKRELFFGEDPVGAKRPPRDTRFQSGNPKGRPKQDICDHVLPEGSFASRSLAISRRKIAVRESGAERSVPAIEAVVLAQIKSALSGNAHAQKHHLERHDRLEREERLMIERQHDWALAYIEHARAKLADAKAKGEPEPDLYPHPDDIVLEPGRPVRFIGPLDAEKGKKLKEKIALREAYIWQAGLEMRMDPKGDAAPVLEQLRSAEFIALELNRTLPPRLRMDEFWISHRIDVASRHAKRVLLKTTRAKWFAAGVRARRGALLPELRQTLSWEEALHEFGAELLKKIKNDS